jgi:3',5'-cyclic AMP phosphodiesterase CpdA
MIRRLTVARSTDATAPPARTVRLLAVSDEHEPALDYEHNRVALGRVDGLIGAGDLSPSYLAFLADAFSVPLLHVRGNHDRGGGWAEGRDRLPEPIDGSWHEIAGLTVAGLSWPMEDRRERAVHDEGAAWRQVAAGYLRFRRRRPDIIVSHVPPYGLGDTPHDHYHRGFAAYRWLLKRIRPALWIHGHTTPAAISEWSVTHDGTTIVNVTGAVLIEMTSAATGTAEAMGKPLTTIEAK